MCLIAYAPKGELIPREVLSFAAAQNDDGIGVMSSDGIRKYLGRKMLKRARRYIEELAEAKTPYAVHLRWATHGAVCFANTHPYQSPEKTHWIMHNGIIGLTTAESSAEESDTAVYVRKFLHSMPDFKEDEKFYRDVGSHIGYSNKLVIMDEQSRFQICNETAGTWIEGIWYSNTYSLPAAFVPRPAYSSGWNAGYGGGGHFDYQDWADEQRERRIATAQADNGYKHGFKYCTQTQSWYDPATHEVIKKTWLNGHTSHMICLIDRSATVVQTGNKDYPNKVIELRPRKNPSGNIGGWSNEDREDYYKALEAGLTPAEACDYLDTGTAPSADADDATEAGEIAALRAEQGRILADAMELHDKEPAPPGGDFAEAVVDLGCAPDDDDEDQNTFKRYLRAIASNVHLT